MLNMMRARHMLRRVGCVRLLPMPSRSRVNQVCQPLPRYFSRRRFDEDQERFKRGETQPKARPDEVSEAERERLEDAKHKIEASALQSNWTQRFGVLGTFAAFAFTKTKWLIMVLKLTKMAPLASMLLSSVAYGLFFGPAYGVGMVGLIFVHEAGHALVMKHYGVPAGPMVFIPFMGASIAMKDLPQTVKHNAYIALGGPVMGSIGAAGVAIAAAALDSQLCYALADFGFMINLFNLLPIGTMDGGRITQAISPRIQYAGLAMACGMIFTGVISNPIFYLITLSSAYSSYQRWKYGGHEPASYFEISAQERAVISIAYAALIVSLLFAMQQNSKNKKSVKQLKIEAGSWTKEDEQAEQESFYTFTTEEEELKRRD